MRTILLKVTTTILFLLSSLPITANIGPFSFIAIKDASPNTLITSNIATITGFDSTISIRIEGGSYTIGNSVPTADEGIITSGATVALQVLSSSELNTQTVATLTVGSGASSTRAIFSVTTRPVPSTPVFTSTPITTVRVGSLYQYRLSASDADSSNLFFRASPSTELPDWLAVNIAVSTLAGAGSASDNDGATNTARFAAPRDIVIDASGNIIITDDDNHNIRRISTEGIVSTIAGTGGFGFADGASVTAMFSALSGIVIDASGDIIVADRGNHRIRNIAPNGAVSTIAGSSPIGGNGGFTDGASATAEFSFPRDVAIDAAGNIIVADTNNHRIRSISTKGIVSTIAGSGFGFDDGASATAGFAFPTGVAIDAGGNIIVADQSSHRIRSISTGGIVTTIAGSGEFGFADGASATSKFNSPTGVAIDAGGNIIVVDQNNNRIRSIAPNGIVATIAGSSRGFTDGIVSNAKFRDPFSIAINNNDIIVADSGNHRIRKIDRDNLVGIPLVCDDIGVYNLELIVSDGEFQSSQSFDLTVVDNGSCDAIPTNLALSIATIFENISPNSVIATVSADDNDNPGSLTFSVVGGRDGASFSISANQLVINHSPDFESQSSYEVIIAVSDDIHLATKTFNISVKDVDEGAPVFISTPITNTRVNNLYRYNLSASNANINDLSFNIAPGTELPSWLTIGPIITTLAGDGSLGSDDGASSTASFGFPTDIAIDDSGNIIVVDRDNNRIRSISLDGMVSTIAGNSEGLIDGPSNTAAFRAPEGIAIDALDNIIIADSFNHRIRRISADGTVTTVAGSGPTGNSGGNFADGVSTAARFNFPSDVAVNALGDIIVADRINNRIRRISTGGMVSTIAMGFNRPRGITIDTGGNIIIADTFNHLIRRISTDEVVSTIAGSGSSGSDDGASGTAEFSFPTDVAVDALGNIIVADGSNHRIRSINTDSIVRTIAGGSGSFVDGIAQFNNPFGVVIDANGDIIVADRGNHRIRKIDRNNIVLMGTPASCSDIGIHSLELIASDGKFQGGQSFDIMVLDDGSCGAIPTNLALSVNTIVENILANSIIATVSADDNDNPASLSFSVVGGRDGASFSISDGNQLVIDHSPNLEAKSSYEIIISAYDGLHTATRSFEINVANIESIPVFTSTPITTINVGSLYQYNLSASDIDSSNFIFRAASGTDLPSWLAIDLVVTTVAGDGLSDDDNGVTSTASFDSPTGIAIDASGNIIIADTDNHRIRIIKTDGVVRTIAGSVFGFADGASSTAQFSFPTGVAIDSLGDIIVADRDNHRIRSISAGGTVTTIAGGSQGFVDSTVNNAEFDSPSDVAIDGRGHIIIADTNNHRIRNINLDDIVSTIAGDDVADFVDGVSDDARFSFPTGVVINSLNDIIVADRGNHSIRRIDGDSAVSTIAGNGEFSFADGASGTARFNEPTGVAINASGNIIVADTNNHRIRNINPDGIVSTIAGDGVAGSDDGIGVNARFFFPSGVAIDASGNIIVTDTFNHIIRKININNFALAGIPASCDDIGIYDLELIVSDGELQSSQSFDIIVADDGSCGAIPTNLALNITTIAESIATNSIIATISADDIDNPASLSFSIVGGRDSASFSISGGNQLVIDHSPNFEAQSSYEIIIAVSDSMHIATRSFEINVVRTENAPVFTSIPITMVRVNSLYQYNLSVSDADSSNLEFGVAPGTDLPSWLAIDMIVTTLAGTGLRGSDNGATSTASFRTPSGVAIDASGNIIVAERNNHRIRSIGTNGMVSTIAGGRDGFRDGASATAQFGSPSGVAIDASGNIVVADRNNNRIRKITTDGMVSTIAGSGIEGFADGASATAEFQLPIGIAVDASGNIIVADALNNSIRSIGTDGMVSTIAGSSTSGFADGASATAMFFTPIGIAVDASGDIIVADRSNHRIRSISTGGVVSTIAGSGTRDFADGASATARFNFPSGVAIDTSGNIIVADRDNHRIRSITPDGIVSTIAGSSISGFADGVVSKSQFDRPLDIAIDASGNIIVADSDNNRIRKIDRNNFALEGTPASCDDVGAHNLELIVSDGEFQGLQRFDIMVLDDGSCGVIPTNLALSTNTIDENIDSDSVIAYISATTTNPIDVFKFGIVGGRDSASFSIIGGNQLVIDHSPDFEVQNSYEIIIGVSDTIHLVTKTFNIGVIDVNEVTPVFTSIPNTTVRVNSLYRYNLDASDTDSSNLVFSIAPSTELLSWLDIGAVVITLAGDGSTQSIDDSPTSTANFNFPTDVVIDALGNIIVADGGNNLIRSISTNGVVTTIAGSEQGFADGASNTAKFRIPTGVAIDNSADIIVVDSLNHRIRSISANGMVDTVAGDDEASFVDGADTVARFSLPTAVAIDTDGNIIIADTNNHSIRSISIEGTVTTIAGSSTSGSDDGASATARFNAPTGVAIDALGNIIIADRSNHRIRSIDADGMVTTIAGSSTSGSDDGASATARFNAPTGIAIDALGNIIVADRNNNRIRSISPEGVVTTIAGGSADVFANGAGSTAGFNVPTDIAIDALGNIIVADRDNHRIRKIDRNSIALAGTPANCDDIGSYDVGLIVSDGEFEDLQSFDIMVLDDGSCGVIPTNLALSTISIIENIATNSIIATIDATATNPLDVFEFSIVGGRDSASFSIISGNQLVIDHSPNFDAQSSYEIVVAVSDTLHIATKSFEINVIEIENVPVFTGAPITVVRINSLYRYKLSASDADSPNLIFSAAPNTDLPSWLAVDVDAVVTTLAGDGSQGSDNGATSTARFNFPAGVVIDASGNIIVADRANHRIRSINTDGMVRTIAGSETGFANGASATAKFNVPTGVAIDASGNIIVADSNNHRIRRIAPDGTVSTIAGTGTIGFGNGIFADGASATARFNNPTGVAIDVSGNIIIADSFNHRIRSITPDGMVRTIAGSETGFVDGASATAKFNVPTGVAIDASGNIVVADRNNHRIRRIAPDGTVSTIAGTGTTGFGNGDFIDGASVTARFRSPFGVAIDASGNIIIADSLNHRIRRIASDGTVSTIAGTGTTGFGNGDFIDGASVTARFRSPFGVAIDASGNIIVADSNNNRISKIDRSNFALRGTPSSCGDIGMHNLALIVSDGEFQDLQSFDIMVLDDGSCGLIPTNLALSATTIIENIATSSIVATISADDSDNPASLSFSIVGGRDSASFSISGDNQLVIDHSPNFDAQSSYEIILGVSDTLHIATRSFEINVIEIENVPVFTGAPITVVRINSLYRYKLSASDADSPNLIFSAAPNTDLPSWLAVDVDAVVTTLAGDGSQGSDNGATSTARFNSPAGVVIDASGNIIVADRDNHRIRSITPDGMVRTIAGSQTGFADGASATAEFNSPTGVAIDASGNIIVADRDNYRIRSIDTDGMVSTIAGSSTSGSDDGASATARFSNPTGVAIDVSGNIIVADSFNHRIRSITPDGMVRTIAGSETGFLDGASATARFNVPIGVAIDASGDIIVADRNNHRIRRIVPDGTVSTIAGGGATGFGNGDFIDGASATARFNSPTGVAIDASGNIIIADSLNHRIRSIVSNNVVRIIAGSGPTGTTVGDFVDGVSDIARFNLPLGVAIDASGNIIIADSRNHRIRKIDRSNFALRGTPSSCGDIGIHNLELVVSDGEFQDLQSFDIMVLDDGSCGFIPTNLALSATTIIENIATSSIVATISADDSDNPASLSFSIVGGRDSASFSISGDNQLVIDHSPNFDAQSSYEIILGVSDILHIATRSFEINVIEIENVPVFTSVPITVARINSLYRYKLSASDADSPNLIFSVAPNTDLPSWLVIDSVVTTLAGEGSDGSNDGATSTASFNFPTAIVIDASGNIIVADRDNHRIRSIGTDGIVRTIAGSQTGFADGASATAEFNSPTGVAIDASGNIIVADRNNHRIRSISTDGMVSTIAGSQTGFTDGASATAEFNSPTGVVIDAGGNIIVADTSNHRIRSITLDGTVTTIAGSQTGFADGASATAEFNSPTGVAIDASGNIIVADASNHRIRSISTSGVVSTIAGSGTRDFADGASATARFNFPSGVAIDANGNIIVADNVNHRIRSISSNRIVTTITGSSTNGFVDGIASNAQFDNPFGVAIDVSGNIIVADLSNHSVRKINRNNFALAGTPRSCNDIGIYNLELVVSDGDFQSSQDFNIIVADDGSCGAIPTNLALSTTTIIENIATNSIIATISADDGDNPASLTFSIIGGRDSASFSIIDDNQLVIGHSPDFEAQNGYEIIIGVSDTIHSVTKIFNIGVNDINEVSPVFTSTPITSIRVDSLYQYSLTARDVDDSNLAFNIALGIDLPSWLAIDLVVTTLAGDGLDGSDDGTTSTASFNSPVGVAIDASGNIIIVDTVNNRIRRINTDGIVSTIAGSQTGFLDGASVTAKFMFPRGVAIDASGDIIIADTRNNRIRRIGTDGIVSTIAGSETGFLDGASVTAKFRFPRGVAIDASGNIIVADTSNHRIRSISTNGIVSTIAGSETGFLDGASVTARFRSPRGVAIDASGNIIVADTGNHRIRRINKDDIVSTIAGSETGFLDGASVTAKFRSPTGVAIDASGNIIVADQDNHRIRSISTDGIVSTIAGSETGFVDGAKLTARFMSPTDIAIDTSGNIIIVDSINHRIRKIDRNSFILVGTPSCDDIGIHNLGFIVSDGEFQDLQSFDIIVADDGSCGAIPTNLALSTTTIIENIATNSIIATISADDGYNFASLTFSIIGGRDSASFSINGDNQLVIDHSPDFEIQSSYEIIIGVSDVIHQVTKTFNIGVNDVNEVSPIFTSIPITTARVNNLYQYSLSARDVDSSNLVFSVSPSTELPNWLAIDIIVTTLAGDGLDGDDDGASATARFDFPTAIAIDASGNIIVADRDNHRIRSISTNGIVSTIAGSETGFADGASATAKFNFPTAIAIDASGNIIVADRDNDRIRSITPNGMVSTIAGSETGFLDGASVTAKFSTPFGIAIDASGNIIVVDSGNHRIRSISPDRTVTTVAGSNVIGFADGASATAKFSFPTGVAIDASGDIIIADSGNNRIRSIAPNGIVSTIAGSETGFADGASATAKFDFPFGIAIDAGGNIIIADSSNDRIRSITPNGIVSTIAGSDTGFVDGIIDDAEFNSPYHIAIDASGNIIIADIGNNSIRKIDRNNLIGTPLSCDDIGIHNLELVVSDGEFQSSQSFTIRVVNDGSCVLVTPFVFDAISDVNLGEIVTSNIITVATNTRDPQSTFTISIEGSNGRYSINDGSYTDAVGVVNVGDSVKVQIVASNQLNTIKTATVIIDNVAVAFTITTTNLIIVEGDNTASYNDLPITISATSSDGQTIPTTWTSSATSVVSFSDPNIGSITIVGVGSALITARRGNDEDSIVFTVVPSTLTPSFVGLSTFIYDTSIRTVVATITSGIISADDVSLIVSGSRTAINAGNYNINLALMGASSPNYRLNVDTLSWQIRKADQSAFSLGADVAIIFGNSLSRTATGISATISAVSYGSSNPSVATVNIINGQITIVSAGTTIITATNIGDNNYNQAIDSYILNVGQLTLTIAIGSTTTVYTGTAITVTTTITNLVNGHEQVSLTISGDQTATNAGSYSFDITAVEGSDSANYILIPTTISWTVAPVEQSELDVTGNATRIMVGQAIIATATNNQPQGTLIISSSEDGIIIINNSTITASNVGITTITITKQVANYNNISASYQLVVIQNTITAIDAGDDRDAIYIPSGTLSAQVPINTQGRVISYATDPADSDVATININTGAITITNVGTVSIVISATATTNYAASADSYLLTINQANQDSFTITASGILIFGATGVIMVVELGSGDGTISYATSPSGIITIDTNGIISTAGLGEATITAIKAGGRNYNDISNSILLEVVARFTLDIDGDGRRLTTTDGILIIRFLTGSTNTIDTTDATTNDAHRNTQQILKFLQRGYDRLDVDDDNSVLPNTDGVLIMRYLADQENLNVDGLDISGARSLEEIIEYLEDIY